MIKLPYSISNFEKLRKLKFYYVDKTQYIEQLENLSQHYLFFLRPRRFGKSLFVSMLEHYYDIKQKADFQTLFGDLYIGQNPTERANSYLILKFNFSGIDTRSPEKAYASFRSKVANSMSAFVRKYEDYFTPKMLEDFKDLDSPEGYLIWLFGWYGDPRINTKIYLLIDEYDHFANEILAFDLPRFQVMVGENGWVRKLYENIKIGTEDGIIDRIYITGVSPLTLDSLTSGFNIGTNLSTNLFFNEMLGFTKKEVREIMQCIEVMPGAMEQVMTDMKNWYNGYRFSTRTKELIYNPNMVLFFATHYAQTETYPEQLLDTNVATDYRKISRLFVIGDRAANNKMLETLLNKKVVRARLVQQFNLANEFTSFHLLSLLFYNGIVTLAIPPRLTSIAYFKMPNYVIERLYYQYFYRLIIERANLSQSSVDVYDVITPLAQDNDIQPLLAHAEGILGKLSIRDKPKLDEKHIKTIFISLFYHIDDYMILSEKEVSLKNNEKGLVDLLLIAQPPFQPHHQFIFELKYLPKAGKKALETTVKAAKAQLKAYLQTPEVQAAGELKAYVVVFVGNKAHAYEINN